MISAIIMKAKLLCLLLMLLPVLASAQKEPRKVLNGRVTADSLLVENITVKNISSNKIAVTDNDGKFAIMARPGDNLLFSGVTFNSAKIVLRPEDFSKQELVIKLDIKVTVLDEVVITPVILTGELAIDAKNLKTLEINNALKPATESFNEFEAERDINIAMPAVGRDMKGIDVAQVYKRYIKKKKKNEASLKTASGQETFASAARQRYSYHFYTEALKIPRKEIDDFLQYSDNGPQANSLLAPDKELELTEYLVNKSYAYLNRKK